MGHIYTIIQAKSEIRNNFVSRIVNAAYQLENGREGVAFKVVINFKVEFLFLDVPMKLQINNLNSMFMKKD